MAGIVGVLRKEVKVLNAVTDWIKGERSHRLIVILISLIVGVCTALAAFVLKFLVSFIQNFLTNEFDVSKVNGLYLIYPAIGILLCSLFVRYVVRSCLS